MVRETSHLGGCRRTIAATRQCDAEYLAGCDRILQVGLIEVAHSEQQYRIGMLGLHLDKLFHHWRVQRILSHLDSVYWFKHAKLAIFHQHRFHQRQ